LVLSRAVVRFTSARHGNRLLEEVARMRVRRLFLCALVASFGCGDEVAPAGTTTGAGGGGGGGDAGAGGGATCPDGYAECDGSSATVCETAIASDSAHCGGCDVVCTAGGAHQLPQCAGESCSVFCEQRFLDCNGDPADGCENGAGTCDATAILTDIDAPTGLEVDEGFVYFGTRGHAPGFDDGTVERVPKAGGARELIADLQTLPLNVTIDDDNVYWGNRGQAMMADGRVLAAPKAGGTPWVVAQGLVSPGNQIVDASTAYWTTREPSGGFVMSAPKDGSGPTTVIAGGLFNPRDLQLYQGALYWMTGGLPPDEPPKLVRYPLPSGPETVIATGITLGSYRIAIHGNFVYAGSFDAMTLFRIAIGGGQEELVTGAGEPHEIVVDEPTSIVYFTAGAAKAVIAVAESGGATTVVATGQVFPSYLTHDATYLYWIDGLLGQPGGSIVRAPKR
jgi:hypothetical protein